MKGEEAGCHDWGPIVNHTPRPQNRQQPPANREETKQKAKGGNQTPHNHSVHTAMKARGERSAAMQAQVQGKAATTHPPRLPQAPRAYPPGRRVQAGQTKGKLAAAGGGDGGRVWR